MSGGQAALLIDFGSTYTKLTALDLGTGRLLGKAQGPSTVTTDVTIGLETALARLRERLGAEVAFRYRLACSSAAGGLRMVTIGLVPELTAQAARYAALGAGAKVVGVFSHRLTPDDLAAIGRLAPDILLLAGGTDGGNVEVIRHNARALAGAGLACPVVVAGNRVAAPEVAAELRAAGLEVVVTANVMPDIGRLDVEPAREAIRRVFLDRIVRAKGIDRAQRHTDVLMPTPTAVLAGARLLAQGDGVTPGLGDLVVVDVGGATTDVHSVCSGEPSRAGVVYRGLPEPFLKRTVEGDLGMRHNALTILETVGAEALARDSGLSPGRVEGLVRALAADVERVPASEEERALDIALARAAVEVAVKRHAGRLATVYTALGPSQVQEGKDLTAVGTVVGTGGVLAYNRDAARILQRALYDPADPGSLRPASPALYLDREYLLYAVGLLAEVDPASAVAAARRHIRPIEPPAAASAPPEGAGCAGRRGAGARADSARAGRTRAEKAGAEERRLREAGAGALPDRAAGSRGARGEDACVGRPRAGEARIDQVGSGDARVERVDAGDARSRNSRAEDAHAGRR